MATPTVVPFGVHINPSAAVVICLEVLLPLPLLEETGTGESNICAQLVSDTDPWRDIPSGDMYFVLEPKGLQEVK